MPTTIETNRRHPVQVSATTHHWIQELAAYEHTSMSKVLERAVERYRATVLLDAYNAAWARLAEEDPQAIAALREEQALWDQTLADGLDTAEDDA